MLSDLTHSVCCFSVCEIAVLAASDEDGLWRGGHRKDDAHRAVSWCCWSAPWDASMHASQTNLCVHQCLPAALQLPRSPGDIQPVGSKLFSLHSSFSPSCSSFVRSSGTSVRVGTTKMPECRQAGRLDSAPSPGLTSTVVSMLSAFICMSV